VIKPEASSVAAGGTYKADILIASKSAAKAEIFFNGKQIALSETSEGKQTGTLQFNTTGGGYDAQGFAKRTAEIEIRQANGDKYMLPLEYSVVSPVIRVSSGYVTPLFMNCANVINIDVPALGADYNPEFKTDGGEIIPGDTRGSIIIVPTKKNFVVRVINKGVLIGTHSFNARGIPQPRYVARDENGNEINVFKGIPSSTKSINIEAEADPYFKEELPRDSKFLIKRLSVMIARGVILLAELTPMSGKIDLSTAKLRPGDRLVIQIKEIARVKYNESEEEMKFPSSTSFLIVQVE
jgi:hypothetical protein